MNPVAVAQFFEATCTGIFKRLLAAGSTEGGLLGPVSIYYGTVETNGRGMLHLHCLVWLRGVFHLAELRSRLQSDPQYAADIVKFIDSIICCSMADISLNETDEEFALKLYKDSNAIASKTQVHSFSHNATCFKYKAAISGKCRFDFPRPCIEETRVTELSSIEISRNNPWINPWNPALTSLIKSNHDINFIPSNVKALALARYITNYATKGGCSQYQRVMGAAFV